MAYKQRVKHCQIGSNYLYELSACHAVGAKTGDDLRQIDATGKFEGRLKTLYVYHVSEVLA